MANVTVVFIKDETKFMDRFVHFDGCTQLTAREYWLRGRKDREKLEIIDIEIIDHWEKEDGT